VSEKVNSLNELATKLKLLPASIKKNSCILAKLKAKIRRLNDEKCKK